MSHYMKRFCGNYPEASLLFVLLLKVSMQLCIDFNMDKRTPLDYDQLKLRRHIEKICKLCSDVLEGYATNCEERSVTP